MPSIPSSIQGQSDATESKVRGLGGAFAVNLAIFQAKYADKKWARYFHFDLNAGCGFNHEANCIGSPLAFLLAARSREVNYQAFFVDINRASVVELMSREEVRQDDRAFVVDGDNASFVPAIQDVIRAAGDRPEMAIGSVFVDDNGTGIPSDELADLSGCCPKLDIFINVTATGLKRAYARKQTRMADIIGAIDKRYWLIREPVGAFQWTMLLGRNIEVGDHKAIGFHHLMSDRGQEVFERCNYTAEELRHRNLRGQGSLF